MKKRVITETQYDAAGRITKKIVTEEYDEGWFHWTSGSNGDYITTTYTSALSSETITTDNDTTKGEIHYV